MTWPTGQTYTPEEVTFPATDGIKLKGWFLSQAGSTKAVVLLHGVRAVVVEASYATLRDTVDDHFRAHTGLPSGYFGALAVPIAEWKLGLNMDDVSPVREISKLKVPVYVIGGASDDLAPPKGVRELYDAVRGEKKLWMVPWAGHADFFSYAEDEYKQRVGSFLRSYLWP